MWTRRETLVGGALSLLFYESISCCHGAGNRAPHSFGCRLADEDLHAIYPPNTDTRAFLTGSEPMIPKSGDKDFDFALAQSLAKISDAFSVLPGFAYYDDYDSQNAYATPVTRLNRADGTVLFGMHLLQRLRKAAESPEVSVVAVCSHEFGHILQFKHGLNEKVDAGQSSHKRSELQADYFAGYFAGLRKREKPNYPAAVAALTQFGAGDSQFDSRYHHGTAEERGAAVVQGFEASFRQRKNLSDAIQESTNYVLQL